MRDRKTSWAGVHNNLALKYLREVEKGDLIFHYSTKEKWQIVGIMNAFSNAYAEDGLSVQNSKQIAVDVAPVEKLIHPVTLEIIKKDEEIQSISFDKDLTPYGYSSD